MITFKEYIKRFPRYLTDKINLIIIFHTALLVSTVVAFFYLGTVKVEESITEQILHREQVIVRTGAYSIDSYLDVVGNGVSLLADGYIFSSVIEPLMQVRLDEYVRTFSGTPVIGISWADKDGIIRHNSNISGKSDMGAAVADREYFIWAKGAGLGDVYISKPFISKFGETKDKMIITVASPTINDGKFEGVLVSAISLNDLTRIFLNPLKISEKDRIYLIDPNGFIIDSPIDKLLGTNYLDFLEQQSYKGKEKSVESLKSALKNNSEGKLNIILPDEELGGHTRFLIAHAPLEIKGNNLVLAIATPFSEAKAYTYFANIYKEGSIISFILLLASMLILIYLIRDIQTRSYSEGKTHGNK